MFPLYFVSYFPCPFMNACTSEHLWCMVHIYNSESYAPVRAKRCYTNHKYRLLQIQVTTTPFSKEEKVRTTESKGRRKMDYRTWNKLPKSEKLESNTLKSCIFVLNFAGYTSYEKWVTFCAATFRWLFQLCLL